MQGDILSQPGRFDPLSPTHPSVGEICGLCTAPIEAGQRVSLAEIGPADEEEAEKAAQGRAHNVGCSMVHESCAYPEEEKK